MAARKLLSHRRRGDLIGTIDGSPVNQVANDVRETLNVTGDVSSVYPIEWVYSHDDGATWTVFDPTDPVRSIIWKQTFFDNFTSALDTNEWSVYDSPGHAGNGVRDPDQVTVTGGNLIITGAEDVTNGVKSGGLEHTLDLTFAKYRVLMKADTDATQTFSAVALAWSPDNGNFLIPVPGGEIDFAEMLAADAATRSVKAFVHGNLDGVNDISTQVTYPGDDGDVLIEYVMERSPGRIDFYTDDFGTGGTYIGSVLDSTTTPIPKGPMHLALQLDALNPTYDGSDVEMEVGYVEINELPRDPVLVKARLVANPSVSTATATVTLVGASNQVAMITDLPDTTERDYLQATSLTATWEPACSYQVQQRDSESESWVNATGAGSSGFGTTTTFGAGLAAVDGRYYRIKLTNGGYYYFSNTTLMDVTTPDIDQTDVRAYWYSATHSESHTVNIGDFLGGTPEIGDTLLFVYACVGPTENATVTYTHVGLEQVFDAPGSAYAPRLHGVVTTYDGNTTSWTLSTNSGVYSRLAALAFDKALSFTIGDEVSQGGVTSINPNPVVNVDGSLGLSIVSVNFTAGSVQAPPDGHELVLSTGLSARQIYIAKKLLPDSGIYDPSTIIISPGGESVSAISLVASPIEVTDAYNINTEEVTLVGVNGFAYVGSNVSSISVPLPVEEIFEGDLIELYVATQESSTASQPNTPTDYTLAYDEDFVTGFIPRVTKFYRIAAGGEQSTSVTVSWPSGTPRPYAVSQVWRHADWNTPYDTVAQSASTGNANPNPPSRTTITPRALVSVAAAGNKTPATAATLPSGYTLTVSQAANVRGFVNCHKVTTTVGAQDPAAYTWAVDNSTVVTQVIRRAILKYNPSVTGGGGGGGSGVAEPTIPTFNSGSAIAITPSTPNVAALVASYPEGTHFELSAGTFTNISDVRPKNNMHFRGQGDSTLINGSGKAYIFRAGSNGTSDGVTIGQMKIENAGTGTTRAEYGAIQAQPTNTVGGEYTYGHANNWFIYDVELSANSASGIRMSDNCTLLRVHAYGHSVTGVGGDRIVGGLIYDCTLEANGLNPATGNGANGANCKLTWVNANEGRTAIIPTAFQRPKAVCRVVDSTFNATKSGITGTCEIGMWWDLDCQMTEVLGCTLDDHTTSAVFWEGCNGGLCKGNTVDNSDGFGPAFGGNFMNGALACGESTNIIFEDNIISNSDYALVNRMSNRTGDWINSNNGSYVNFGWPTASGGVRYWITYGSPTPVPTTSVRSNVWTGGNIFRRNVLTNCNRVVINEGTNGGGQTTQGSTPLSTIQFDDNDYSGSSGILFYNLSNTGINLSAWRALPYVRDQV